MGPRLVFGRFDGIQGRIDTTSVRTTSCERGYDDGAVVPRDDWHPLSREAAERLRPDASIPASVRIELVRRRLPAFEPQDIAGRLEAASSLDPLPGRWPSKLLGCTVSHGDRRTTTENSTTGRRIGLHVDNFDRLPYGRRHEGRRRLCLNLGPGSRYLLLGGQDIEHICRALKRDLEQHWPHTEDVRRYVTEGLPLRCLRIRLDPGDGYIAPTEFLPHDGSTAGIALPSVAAFWLGQPR
ncbi:hypothetical protein [Streptomyces jumonjinensis]|uniref:hypothetical protein n=1 Tax=Streptomyces jumonjinensis TaxID=1945 RepID=UPI0037A733F1